MPQQLLKILDRTFARNSLVVTVFWTPHRSPVFGVWSFETRLRAVEAGPGAEEARTQHQRRRSATTEVWCVRVLGTVVTSVDAAANCDRTSRGKATHPVAILQGRTADILCVASGSGVRGETLSGLCGVVTETAS